jgi:hypothetical protein
MERCSMKILPDAFKTLENVRQFIIYRLLPSETRPGKTDKMPIDYRTAKIANAHDKEIWTDVHTAMKLAEHLGVQHGVGFVLTKEDYYWFLDIDSCFNSSGWSELAISLCSEFAGAAIEISSSGNGLHILGTGSAPVHACKNKNLNLEFYTEGRFVALTGHAAQGDISKNFGDKLSWLVSTYFENHATQFDDWTTAPAEEWDGPESDQELIKWMLNSQSAKAAFGTGATFKDLWENNTEKFREAYPDSNGREYDASSVDAALAQHLAYWTGNNCERMRRLMEQSGLVREKWEREDYLYRTIMGACSKQKKFLKMRGAQELQQNFDTQLTQQLIKASMVTGNTFLTAAQQIELFAGCVYVCDIHKILIPGGYVLKPDQFRTMYGGFSFPMDPQNERVSRNAWEAFTESQSFRAPKADSSTFRPVLTPGAIIKVDERTLANTWWPIVTPRKKGDPTPFLRHLAKLWPLELDHTILLNYFAALIQYKGVKFQWAPLLQGVEGNGKTLFSRCLAFAIGERYTHSPKATEIASRFNDWMYGKILITVEDIYVPDAQLLVLEILKPMITLSRQEIEGKNGAKVTLDVCANFILNSNHKDGIRKTRNNRIFAPFYAAQQSLADLNRDGLDATYFTRLYDWLKNDGYAIVSDYLHDYKIIDEFNPATKCQRAPLTTSTEDAISLSIGGIEQEVLESIEQGAIGFKNGWISSMAFDRLLERLGAERRIPHNKRRELLQNLGYDWHPGLNCGRVNRVILPDGGKPKLYIKLNHVDAQIVGVTEITEAYTQAQV